MVWLGRASLKPCSGKVCFGSFRVALVHLEALSSDQLMKREGWLCWSSVRPGPGFLELWSRYGLAMVWLGRASLKPCSGKDCFGSFRVALVHLEALSSDQLMKREGWLCWSSVRPGPGFLELWSRYGLAMVWLGRASLKPCSGKVCFGSFRVALVHLAGGHAGMVRHVFGVGEESWAVRLPGLGPGGRAWPRSKVVRRSHRQALSSDQLMKREGWLCWSSVRPGPGFLELWSRYGLAGFGWAGLP